MSSDGNHTGERIKRTRTAEDLTLAKLVDKSGQETDLAELIFDCGFRAGYLSAKIEILKKTETWLSVKRDDDNGNKDHKETS